MNRPIIGYLKKELLIDKNGSSLGEDPHYSFQLISPIEKDIYLADNIDGIRDINILEELYNNDVIENTNYSVNSFDEYGYLEIIKNLFKEIR